MRAISIGYHDVLKEGGNFDTSTPLKQAGLYRLTQKDFHGHLAAIQEAGCQSRVATLDQFRRWDRPVPVFLTFDDGTLGSLCAADELEQRGWRGHFFIVTDWIGRAGFLDAWQIRELHGRGHVIGSHSCSHPERMSRLAWGDLMREWTESQARLCDVLGEPVKTASVANGYYSRKVGKAAAASGLEVLFTSEPTSSVSVLDGCLVVGRYSVQDRTPPGVSGAIAAGAMGPRWRQSVLWGAKKAAKALAGESYFAIRRFLLSRGQLPL
jgi:peptidoglycan/xylan/chitin deacetylase (PgdA/CDA1 family)